MTWQLAQAAGVRVRLHPAALLFAGYMLLTGRGAMLAAALVSILLHEAAHALCAGSLGWPPQAMELSPLGAVLRLDDEAEMPSGKRLLMLLAGPMMTLLLAAAAYHFTRWGILPRGAGRLVFLCNLGLLMMNLLPVLPLDGGRLLAMGLAGLLPGRTVRRVMRVLGTGAGLALIGLNLYAAVKTGAVNWSLTLIGCYLLYAASVGTASAALEEVRSLRARQRLLTGRGIVAVERLAVLPDTPLRLAVRRLPARRWAEIAVMDEDGRRVTATAGEAELIETYLEAPGDNCSRLADKTCQRLRL